MNIEMNETYINNNIIDIPASKSRVYIKDIDIKSPKNIYTLLSNNKNIYLTIKNNTSNNISLLNYTTINDSNTLDIILQNNSINIIWTSGKFIATDISTTKTFDVFMYKLSDTTAFVKPAIKYDCSIFEHIFNFGFQCEGYNENKIIYIYTK